MRVIFMGTPDFAVGTLEAVIGAGYEVVLVVTQPDKPKGRGKNLAISPVKECALAHDIPVFQPRRIREPENIETLRSYAPDMIVVAAFGQILPKEIIDMPPYGCINVHASLLPKYRGAAPIQWAVIDGEEKTGVTIMKMGVGLDDGDIIAQEEVTLAADETGGSLFDRLAVCGARLCAETMPRIFDKTAVYTPQDEAKATHVHMIKKEMGAIDWTRSAAELERLIRGLNPWPSAYTSYKGKTLKLWRAEVLPENSGMAPGTVCASDKKALHVQTGEGILLIRELQLEGKKRMEADAFLRGFAIEEGETFDVL